MGVDDLNKEKLVDMLRTMETIRQFETSLSEAVAQGILPGFVHLGIGQEGVMTGVCKALRPTDWISSTHRDHGVIIARGGDIKRMRAELFGKGTGYCKGKGGSMHLAALDLGATGCNGILGPSQTIANGIAFALKQRGTGDISVVSFGDGAANRGDFHEAMNLAAVWKLPTLFICVNNNYGMSVPFDSSSPVKDIAARAGGYGCPGLVVDGNDIMAVYEAVSEATERLRQGSEPILIECKTDRWRGHFEGDSQPYRTPERVAEIKQRDPIVRFREKLIEMKVITEEGADQIVAGVTAAMEEAIKFADESPYPDLEETMTDLYYVEGAAR